MRKKIKKNLHQRIFRLNFIKTELNRLVSKSFFKNTYFSDKNSITSTHNRYYKNNKKFSLSFFRLYSMLDMSPKLVSKRYRLSRFSMNLLAKNATIPGFVKRGW